MAKDEPERLDEWLEKGGSLEPERTHPDHGFKRSKFEKEWLESIKGDYSRRSDLVALIKDSKVRLPPAAIESEAELLSSELREYPDSGHADRVDALAFALEKAGDAPLESKPMEHELCAVSVEHNVYAGAWEVVSTRGTHHRLKTLIPHDALVDANEAAAWQALRSELQGKHGLTKAEVDNVLRGLRSPASNFHRRWARHARSSCPR